MEQVLYRLHIKILTTTSRVVTYEVRRLLEFGCLIVAICSLFTLFLLHSTYVINSYSPRYNCLLNAIESFEHYSLPNGSNAGINQNFRNRSTSPFSIYAVKLNAKDPPPPGELGDKTSSNSRSIRDENLQQISKAEKIDEEKHYSREGGLLTTFFDNIYQNSEDLYRKQGNNICELYKNPQSDEQQYPSHCHQFYSPPSSSPSAISIEQSSSPPLSIPSSQLLPHKIPATNITIHTPEGDYLVIRSFFMNAKDLALHSRNYSYIYTFDRSVLMLSQEIYQSNPDYLFSVLELEVLRSSRCFGPKITNRFVDLAKALDVVIMNWMIASFDGQGYLYNTVTRELLNLNYAKQWIAKKGIQLHEMGRRESYAKTHSNNYLNFYLDFVKQVMLWNRATVIGPFLTMLYEWLDGLLETMIESIRSTTLFQLLINRLDAVDNRDSTAVISTKLLTIFHQYLLFRLGVICSTLFLFFISSTLISYILRETQERMVRFTFLLQYHVVHNLPITSLVFTHVTESLIFVPIMMGIYFFLFEFFSDQLLAFLVLLVVWIAEVFSILSLRSKVSIEYFPRIFFYYFCLFHIYFFSYPFGFSYLALFTAFVFVFHAIMHFWNVYEVPAVEAGVISPAHPRIGRRIPVAATPTPSRDNENAENEGSTHRASAQATPARTRTSSAVSSATASPDRVATGGSTRPVNDSTSATQTVMADMKDGSSFSDIIGRAVNAIFSRGSDGVDASNRPRSSTVSGPSNPSRRSGGRFVIQLPNIDVTRNNFSQIPSSSSAVASHRSRRSSTESDLTSPPSLDLPHVSTLSSESNSSKSTPTTARADRQSPSATVAPALTSEHLRAASSLASVGASGNRPRSSSNVSVGSIGSAGSASELRRMRLEQEKLRYNINKPPLPNHPAAQSYLSGEVSQRRVMHVPSPPFSPPTAATLPVASQASGSQVSMVTARSGASSDVASPTSPHDSLSHAPPLTDRKSLEFPLLDRELRTVKEEAEAENEDNPDSRSRGSSRRVLSKDDLIGFFLETDREEVPTTTSAPHSHENIIMKTKSETIREAKMSKNYSFNVFGNVLDDEEDHEEL